MRVWTVEDLENYAGLTMSVPEACEALQIAQRTKAFDLLRRGELPFPVITAGHRYRVAVAEVKRLAGLTPPLDDAQPIEGAP